MKVEDLLGSWLLTEFANITSEGRKVVWRGTMSGRLIYALPNVVSVAINRNVKNGAGQSRELNSFYAGTFRFKSTDTIEHIVEQSSDSARIGDVYARQVRLTGDLLEIRGKGLTGDVALVWQREG